MNCYFKVQKLEKSINGQKPLPLSQKNTLLNNNHINNLKSGLISMEANDLISNIDEFESVEKIPMKKDANSLYFNYKENRNNSFQYKNKLNSSFILNLVPDFSTLINSFPNNNSNLNKQIPKDISQTQKEPEIFYSEEGKNNKRTQSKYSSVSENKYHFMNKISENPLIIFSENNIPKTQINYNPVKTLKSSKKDNLNNSMNIDYSKYNTKSYVYIPQNNSQQTVRDNRFLNKKMKSSYKYNTISGSNFQEPLQIATVTPISYDQNPYPISNINKNKIILNSKNKSGFPIKNATTSITNMQNYFNNYLTNSLSTVNNFENQRLTVGNENITNKNYLAYTYDNNMKQTINQVKKNNSSNFNQNFKVQKNEKPEPEIATVTKIFSLHTLSSNPNNKKTYNNITENNNTNNQLNNKPVFYNSINVLEFEAI